MRPAIFLCLALFMGNIAGRAIYVHLAEFKPAQKEWEAAHTRGDREGMLSAFQKELEASGRTFDPLWFAH